MRLLLDRLEKGFYSSRLGLNLYPLSNSNYILCFELLWLDANIDPDTVYINGISSIETIHICVQTNIQITEVCEVDMSV